MAPTEHGKGAVGGRMTMRQALLATGGVALLLAALVLLVPWAPEGAPMAEEVVALRCLTPDLAVEELRPLLAADSAATVVVPAGSPVLRIRARPEVVAQARTWLAGHDTGCDGQ